jgi:hypothetical protein
LRSYILGKVNAHFGNLTRRFDTGGHFSANATYREVSGTRDREAAKLFLERALRTPITNRRRFSRVTDCAVTQRPFGSSKLMVA